MSKTTKTIIIIAAVMIVIGVALCTIAFSSADWSINKLYSLVNNYDAPDYQEQEYRIPAEGLSQLKVDTVTDNAIIRVNPENDIRVVCRDTQYYVYQVEASGNTLSIDYRKPDSFFGWINLIPHIAPANVEIWLPESFFTEGNIDLDLVSGDIYLENIRGNDFHADTVSGDIQISGCNFTQINWQTVSGDVALSDSEGVTSKGETTSGNIQIRDCAFEEMLLSTISGEIEARLLGDSHDYRIEAQSVSGDIEKDRGNDQADKTIYLETVSGDIDLQFILQ